MLNLDKITAWVVCPNFNTLPRLRHSKFTHFVDAVGI